MESIGSIIAKSENLRKILGNDHKILVHHNKMLSEIEIHLEKEPSKACLTVLKDFKRHDTLFYSAPYTENNMTAAKLIQKWGNKL